MLFFLLFGILSGCSQSTRENTAGTETGADTTTQAPSPQENDSTSSIRVDQPEPDQDIHSPLAIRGEAKGYWYFEGDFQVLLVDYQGNELASAVASAQGEWMTEEFVPFTAEMTFDSPDDERGYLVFQRANPSGLPENAEEFRLPVIFPPQN